jgi:hypothetical protein
MGPGPAVGLDVIDQRDTPSGPTRPNNSATGGANPSPFRVHGPGAAPPHQPEATQPPGIDKPGQGSEVTRQLDGKDADRPLEDVPEPYGEGAPGEAPLP